MNREATRREGDMDGSADNRQERNNEEKDNPEMRGTLPQSAPEPVWNFETEDTGEVELRKRRQQAPDRHEPKRLPDWACGVQHRQFIDDYSREQLRTFREMEIGNLGRDFISHAKAFETYFYIGRAYHVGVNSLLRVSHLLEARQRDGECPDHLSVSLTSLHRMVGKVEKFFRGHFDLPVEPRFLLWLGDGLPATRLTDIGQVAWELVRDYLKEMGYDTDGPKKKNR